jgi:hypothetical protein
MIAFESFPLNELKLVYRVLHRSLLDETELMDSTFLSELQAHLQRAARSDGVDTSDHSAWAGWLGETRPPRSGLTLLNGGRA